MSKLGSRLIKAAREGRAEVRTLQEVIASLPAARRAKIASGTAKLIEVHEFLKLYKKFTEKQ